MDNENRSNSFQYTYSAKEQEELKRIRSKYMPKEEDQMEVLRRMDASVTHKATACSLVIGFIGVLLLGIGMSCCMVWGNQWFAPGIVIGVIGMGVLGFAYPIYNRVLYKERERIAPEVLRITDRLMK